MNTRQLYRIPCAKALTLILLSVVLTATPVIAQKTDLDPRYLAIKTLRRTWNPPSWEISTRKPSSARKPIVSAKRGLLHASSIGGEWVIRGAARAWRESLFHETRSIVVNANEEAYQIDLPAPRFLGFHTADKDGDPRLEVRVTGLLPGFQMAASRSDGGSRPLTQRWVQENADGSVTLALNLPEGDRAGHNLTLINVDGSRTSTVGLQQSGAKIVGAATMKSKPIAQATFGRSISPSTLVEWDKKHIRLIASFSMDPSDEIELVRQVQPFTNRTPRVESQRRRMVISGDVNDIKAALHPGTRSMWILQRTDSGTLRHRVDLQRPKLVGAEMEQGGNGRGPTATVAIENLLPGFVISWKPQDRAESPTMLDWNTDAVSKGRVPMIENVRYDLRKGGSEVLLQFPRANESAGDIVHLLTLINFDGSRSGSISVTQRGDALVDAKQTARARAAPIDQLVETPDLVSNSAVESAKSAKALGLHPVIVDAASGLQIESLRGLTIVGQGLAPGFMVQRGELLLLSAGSGALNEEAYDAGAELLPGPRPLDVGARGGFASIDETLPVDSLRAANAAISGDGDVAATVASLAEDDTAIAISADPGVVIDPSAVAGEQQARAGLLQNVLSEVERRLSDGERLGVIGELIADSGRRNEEDLRKGLSAGNSSDAFAKVYDYAAKHLDIGGDGRLRQDAIRSYEQFAAEHRHPALVDHNENGVVTDDIMGWLLTWLVQRNAYNPARHVILQPSKGKAVAVFPKTTVDPKWIAGKSSLQTAGKEQLSAAERKRRAAQRPLELIAKKDLNLLVASAPDQVRVPTEIIGMRAETAIPRIENIGLHIGNESETIRPQDEIRNSLPVPGTWVEPSKRIVLAVDRIVPSFIGKTIEEVRSLTNKYGLKFRRERDFDLKASDVVYAQDAKENKPIDPRNPIELSFHRRFPSVLGKEVSEAAQILKNAGFRLSQPDANGPKIIKQNDEIVDVRRVPSPKPEHRHFGIPGRDKLQLVNVKTRVPNLAKTSLASAVTKSQAESILRDYALNLNIKGLNTDYASARVLEQSPAAGKLIDRRTASMTLAWAIPVPRIGGRVQVVRESLAARGLRGDPNIARLRNYDQVLEYKRVAGRTFRSDGQDFATPNTKFELIVGRPIPRTNGIRWGDALNRLNADGFRGVVARGFDPGPLVLATSPSQDKLHDLRRDVVMIPGVLVPNAPPNVRPKDLETEIRRRGLAVKVDIVRRPTANPRDQGRSVVRVSPPSGTLVEKSQRKPVRVTVEERFFDPPPKDGLLAVQRLDHEALFVYLKTDNGRRLEVVEDSLKYHREGINAARFDEYDRIHSAVYIGNGKVANQPYHRYRITRSAEGTPVNFVLLQNFGRYEVWVPRSGNGPVRFTGNGGRSFFGTIQVRPAGKGFTPRNAEQIRRELLNSGL